MLVAVTFLSRMDQEKMVRAEEAEPAQHCRQRIFLPLRLSPHPPKMPWGAFAEVRGLDYPFTAPASPQIIAQPISDSIGLAASNGMVLSRIVYS